MLACALLLSGAAEVSSDPARAENSMESAARACATPDQISRFLRENVLFQEDQSLFGQADYWQTPEELLARRKGDCEDYALLACDLLLRQGKEAFVFSLYGEKGYAHTVCVFVEGGRFSVLNQDRLVRYGASSLEELAGQLYSGWTWGAVAQRHGHRGRAARIIRSASIR